MAMRKPSSSRLYQLWSIRQAHTIGENDLERRAMTKDKLHPGKIRLQIGQARLEQLPSKKVVNFDASAQTSQRTKKAAKIPHETLSHLTNNAQS